MKINYLRNPIEDKAISMVQYIDDLINYQKKLKDLEISDYTPKFSPLLNIFPFNWKMRIARYFSYPNQIKKLPMYDITHIGDQSYSHLVNHFKNSFSRISTFEKLQDIQNNRTSYIQNTLKPFKLNKDFSVELSNSMKDHEDRLKASLGLQDDNFIIKLLLPGNPISGNAMSMNEDTLIWKFGLDSLLGAGFNLYAESVITSKDKLQKTTILIIFFLLLLSIILIKKQN